MTEKRPEILSPAGDMERLEYAIAYGADAVYLAGKSFGMRAAAGNFSDEELEAAVAYAHERGVRVYVTCNTLPRNDEAALLPEFLERVDGAGADGLIIADAGVFALAKKYAPHVERHISTQAGIVNYESARAWHDMGASRVVLARELSLGEIREIRDKTPKELEIECFVHGSMCVSVSGRCLLSNYMAGRDSQRGACAQPCRWKYALMEERREGEYFPVFEENGQTYIMNSRDMCLIEHIPELVEAGINSFKIEGRMKTAYYAAVITSAYRHALDAALEGRPPDGKWLEEVNNVSHRHYFTGFYFGDGGNGQYYDNSRYIRDCEVSAVVVSCDETGNAVLSQRNRFYKGDPLELITPRGDIIPFTAGYMENGDGQPVEVCPHPEMEIRMRLPAFAPQYSMLRRRTKKSPPEE